jgi:hypothetical protein
LTSTIILLLGCQTASKKVELTPRESLKILNTEFEDANNKFRGRLPGIKAREEFEKTLASKYAPQYVQFLKKYPSDPATKDAAIWITENCWPYPELQADVAAALNLLSEHFVQSPTPEFLATVQILKDYDTPEADKFLQAVYQHCPDKKIRGVACLVLAERASEISSKAKVFLKDAMTEYKDVDAILVGHAKVTKIGDIAARNLFELEHLSIGQEAPNILAEDVYGKKMKLSDYRGKVILVSFFGDW